MRRIGITVLCLLAAGLVIVACEKPPEPPPAAPARVVPGASLRTFAYGPGPDQKLDVYAPPGVKAAPVIVIVHGGGWREGNRASPGVVGAKLTHWLPEGFILVSIDYGLLPNKPVEDQAHNVAKALSYVETHAPEWGGDGGRVILMGHSAGAHMAALLSADPSQVAAAGGKPWGGTVVLDSGGFDLTAVMAGNPGKVYRAAFGTDPTYWARLSPAQRLRPGAIPMMLVCSTQRHACGQSDAFATRIAAVGGAAQILPQDLSHMDINDRLGLPGTYTDAVDSFIAARLKSP